MWLAPALNHRIPLFKHQNRPPQIASYVYNPGKYGIEDGPIQQHSWFPEIKSRSGLSGMNLGKARPLTGGGTTEHTFEPDSHLFLRCVPGIVTLDIRG